MLQQSSRWMRQCQDLLSRDRNTGAHWYSDATLLHPLNYGRKYQYVIRASNPFYGLTSLMVVDVIVRVACWLLEQSIVSKDSD